MVHSLDGKADGAEDAEVEMLVNELVSEFDARRARPEITRLAAKLQALIDEQEAKTEGCLRP